VFHRIVPHLFTASLDICKPFRPLPGNCNSTNVARTLRNGNEPSLCLFRDAQVRASAKGINEFMHLAHFLTKKLTRAATVRLRM